jgi:enoyl-CoA hydratase/carnithine racemase
LPWAAAWSWRWPAICASPARKAKFGQPEINLGLIPGFGGTQRLLRLAGRGAALELCLTGATINAQRAYELGIVTRVVAPDALDEAVQHWPISSRNAHRWPLPAFSTPYSAVEKPRSTRAGVRNAGLRAGGRYARRHIGIPGEAQSHVRRALSHRTKSLLRAS